MFFLTLEDQLKAILIYITIPFLVCCDNVSSTVILAWQLQKRFGEDGLSN
jgi:ABC-type iron transport system FetAB permease component